jgi:hypothetical protein
MRRRCGEFGPAALALAVALGFGGCARTPQRQPAAPAPRPAAGGALFEPAPPARMLVAGEPLGLSPDGLARWLVRVSFRDASGNPTTLVSGGDVAFTPSRGSAQWQTRARFDAPAAIVSTAAGGPLAVVVRANVGVPLAAVRAQTDTRRWRLPAIVAAALGPHEVRIGWFPSSLAPVTIRRGADVDTTVPAPSSSFSDASVRPGTRYEYAVSIPGRAPAVLAVRVPPEPAHGALSAAGGKAMWLAFSPVAADPDSFARLDPEAVVAQAARAGIRALELRTTYGEFRELTPRVAPVIDALLDGAAAHGIAVVAWTVPRAPSFEDLAAEVEAARYRTARGHGFAALAVDLERGDYYLGDGPSGYAALGAYLAELRRALGPGYPLIATVEDPFLEHLSGVDYPYAAIAASADALQPMAYWRMLSRRAVTPAAVRAALRGSYAATRREAERAIPIDIGGQTSPEGPRGAPPPAEIAAAIDEARRLGAFGIAFYDWGGTNGAQFAALERARW